MVVSADGDVLASAGQPDTQCYPRSALKPFQAAASLGLIDEAPPTTDELAVMAASHTGSRTHQAVVLRVLGRAGVTPAALRCPRALPLDRAALRERPEPTRLAHNCSGKHAGFLVAAQRLDVDPARYLEVESVVQRAVARGLREACDVVPAGPGVDGCGAPAWRMPLVALATGYARLAAADGPLQQVASAMRTHPELVGGQGVIDTEIMHAHRRLIAKRGAEATLGIAVRDERRLGVAIKVSDGAARALGPVAGAVLARLNLPLPPALARPHVLGGNQPHGEVRPTAGLEEALAGLR